jgi:hypothetical protein
MIEGKSFPPSERGMCWWIDLASSPSKRRRIVLQRKRQRMAALDQRTCANRLRATSDEK